MANRRSLNVLSQMRLNVSDVRSIESAVRSDFDELISSFAIGESASYILRGFEINVSSGTIGSSATSLQMLVANSSLFHGKSNTSGTFFQVPNGTPNEILNSTTNQKVDGSFTPNSLNYVGLELIRQVDQSTVGQAFFWNPTNKSEFSKTVPLAQTLNYRIVITSTLWASNVLPIAIIDTNSANAVVSIEDSRPMFFRLGTAGTSAPNPFHTFDWSNHLAGREENPFVTGSDVSPFQGGDKQIRHLKEWADAVMSQIKELKGTSYWYSFNKGGSILKLRNDVLNAKIVGAGIISHDAVNAGQLNWDLDFFITFVSSRMRFKIETNSSPSTDLTLGDNEVAYIKVVRDVDIVPRLIFTQGSATVTSVGNVAWTGDVQPGDFIKVAAEDLTKYYEIATVVGPDEVTLTEVFQETSTGIVGALAQYAWGTYSVDAVPSTDRHMKIAPREEVPFDEDIYWLFLRSDNGSPEAKIYLQGIGSGAELEQGESQQISDNTTLELLSYVGSTGETDSTPNYYSNIRGVVGENLTARLGVLTDAIGDSQEDRSMYFRSDGPVVWTGSQLEFTADIVLEIVNTKSGAVTAHTIQAAQSPIALANGESAYIAIDRTIDENVTVILSGITPIPAQSQVNKDVVVLGRRQDVGADGFLHLPLHKQVIEPGQSVRLGASGRGGGGFISTFYDPFSTVFPVGPTFTVDNVAAVDGDLILFSNLSNPLENNQVYEISGVGVAIAFNPVRAFQNGFEPISGESVRFMSGDTFATQLAVFNGTNFYINDTVRYFDGVSGNYWEQTSIKTSDIDNNTTGTIFSTTALGSENIVVDYSIVRGGSKETGQLMVTHDGTDADVSGISTEIGDIGVTFNAYISGGDLFLDYESNNLAAGTMKYSIKRWSDAPGGPSGIPVYSPSSGSSVTAAGNTGDIQFKGAGGNLDADSRLNFNAANGVLDLNGLNYRVLSNGFTLIDNTASPTTIFQYDASLFPHAVVEYSVERNGVYRTGRFLIAGTSGIPAFTDDYAEQAVTDVTFSADIVGGDVRVRYTTASTGFDGNFKYTIRRWG